MLVYGIHFPFKSWFANHFSSTYNVRQKILNCNLWNFSILRPRTMLASSVKSVVFFFMFSNSTSYNPGFIGHVFKGCPKDQETLLAVFLQLFCKKYPWILSGDFLSIVESAVQKFSTYILIIILKSRTASFRCIKWSLYSNDRFNSLNVLTKSILSAPVKVKIITDHIWKNDKTLASWSYYCHFLNFIIQKRLLFKMWEVFLLHSVQYTKT